MEFTIGVISTAAPSPGLLSQGWDDSLDLGTDGDLFVDAVNGSDSNDGLTIGTAKQTIGAAISVASAGDTIRVRTGTYREQVTMASGASDANRTEVFGYAAEKPIVTGADALTGWVACDSGDNSRVGSNWASMYKRTGLAKTAIANDEPICLNLHENGTKMDLCVGWDGDVVGDKFFFTNPKDFYTADSVNTSGGNIQSYVDSGVTGAYTSTQIENCLLIGHADPNVNFFTTVTGVSGTTISIADTSQEYETNANRDNYCLVNLLPAMVQGEFGWWDNGDGTIDVYCWPNDSANLTSNIEYSVRPHCFDISGESHITLKGLDLRQSAGFSGTRDGPAIGSYLFSSKYQNVTIEHCRVKGVFALGGGEAGITIRHTDNVKIHNCTIEDIQGGFGIEFTADVNSPLSTTSFCEGMDLQFNKVTRSAGAAYRFYTCLDGVVAFNRAEGCGRAAHANKMNFYEQCDSILIWGNSFIDCDGYLTFQEASGLVWAFNFADATGASESNTSRTFVDQNNGTTPPNEYNGGTLDMYVINNTFLPAPVAISGTAENGMAVTDSNTANDAISFTVLNNLYHGHVVAEAGLIDAWSGNWNTGPDGIYTVGNISATPENVWTHPSIGDFSILAASPIRSATGDSIQTIIDTVLKPLFSDRFSGWDMDALGNTFDDTSPPVGAVEGYDYADLV